MQYYVSAKAKTLGFGTKEAPFRTVQQAADIAKPGDEVIVLPGVYREWVNPKNGGTEDAPIIYRAAEYGKAVIKGSEVVNTWQNLEGTVWFCEIGNGIFGDYNPYTTLVSGDWYTSEYPLHTGELYVNGKSMYEVSDLESVKNDKLFLSCWYPQDSAYKWFAEQKDGKTVIYANFQGKDPNKECVEMNVRRRVFFPEVTGINYITVQGFVLQQAATQWAPPTAFQDGLIGPHWSKGWVIEDCEVSDSKCCGISLGKYLQPNNENKWFYKRVKNGTQTERDAICQAQFDGWSKETVGSHTVRRCHIHDCEQTGIVGHMGGVFSVIEENHIHHINTKQQLLGAEVGGIKMHAAIDTVIRRNNIHHCSKGLWLDWQAQGTRVTQNLFHHNIPPKEMLLATRRNVNEDLFIEVSHGPTLVDNNLLLSGYAVRLCTQGTAFVHNIICGPFTKVLEGTDNGGKKGIYPRYTPYHVPHRTEVAGFMTFLHGDDRFYNNIFIGTETHLDYADRLDDLGWKLNRIAGTKPFDGFPTAEEYFSEFFKEGDKGDGEDIDKYYRIMPIYTGGNVFLSGAQPCDKEQNFYQNDAKVQIEMVEKDGKWVLETNLYDFVPKMNTGMISTAVLGEAFEPEQLFENPDGTPITFNMDFFGKNRSVSPTPGPFECAEEAKEILW